MIKVIYYGSIIKTLGTIVIYYDIIYIITFERGSCGRHGGQGSALGTISRNIPLTSAFSGQICLRFCICTV